MADHYQEQREAEHFVNKTSTPESDKDSWQTPIELFNALDMEFNFVLDACASEKNALCKLYFTKERCAINNDWYDLLADFDQFQRGSVFINPPYSMTREFLHAARIEAKDLNITVVALVNANTDTKWFAEAVETANEIRLITGRVGFVRADGKKANGNTKGQCLIIWRGNCETPCQITMVDRDQLLADGDI
jgi:phage N-6-adenine-methyltransferase